MSEIACSCGRVLQVPDGAPGTTVICTCGQTLEVPADAESPRQPHILDGIQHKLANEDAFQAAASQIPSETTEAERAAEFHELLKKLTPLVIVTPTIVVINTAIFLLMVVSGVDLMSPKIPDLIRWGADYGPQTLNGEWWRMLSCVFIHIGVIHLLFNMWVLSVAGPLVERMIGNVGFLVMYLIAGLTGSIASLYWNPQLVSAGASGAIFGVYGALFGILLQNRRSLPRKVMTDLKNSGLGFLVINLFYGMSQANVDSAAHVGGLVGGFLCGFVLGQPLTQTAVPNRLLRNLLAMILGVVLTTVGVLGVSSLHHELADLSQKVQRGQIDVYYANGATQAEAERLGDYLLKEWGAQGQGASVMVRKNGDGYQFRMVVKSEFLNNEQWLNLLQFTAARISRDVYGGAEVEMHACDDHFKTVKILKPNPEFRYGLVKGSVEVFYGADIDKSDVERLADHLATLFKEVAGPISFRLARRENVMEIHMVSRQEILQDPAILQGMEQDRKAMEQIVFPNRTVELHLCDDHFKVIKVLKP